MGIQGRKRKLAVLLSASMLSSAVFGFGLERDMVEVYGAEGEAKNYFAQGSGTGIDFSADSWDLATVFGSGADTSDPASQAGIVENEHSGKQEKIIRLINNVRTDAKREGAVCNRAGMAIVGDKISLNESSEFSAKFTISMPDAWAKAQHAGGGMVFPLSLPRRRRSK